MISFWELLKFCWTHRNNSNLHCNGCKTRECLMFQQNSAIVFSPEWLCPYKYRNPMKPNKIYFVEGLEPKYHQFQINEYLDYENDQAEWNIEQTLRWLFQRNLNPSLKNKEAK